MYRSVMWWIYTTFKHNNDAEREREKRTNRQTYKLTNVII